jgi:hypothetical protein
MPSRRRLDYNPRRLDKNPVASCLLTIARLLGIGGTITSSLPNQPCGKGTRAIAAYEIYLPGLLFPYLILIQSKESSR